MKRETQPRVPPTGASDARSSQAVAAPRDARQRPSCTGTALETFARQVLVFPLLVVVLACAAFLLGGTCAAWQWWTAVAAVVLVPFVRKDRRRAALGAAGLFALLLFALRCLIPPLLWDSVRVSDMPVYHLPMVQLLIEGWNPVADPLAEEITASLGLDLWGMAPLHVAFLPKTLAVFSAAAYTFVRDPYALTFPLPVFLWLGVFLSGIRLFRGFVRWAFVAALVFVLPTVTGRMPVDLSLAFASCGLLLTMQDALRRKRCDWMALTAWAAWMMNLKLNGVLAAFVFCAIFVAAKIWKERTDWRKWLVRFAAFGGVLILLWGLISWNPLGTSWRNYGHPLYPFKTVDAERSPVKDLTWDLQGGNDDFFKMGRAGLLAHAYLGPETTIAWYRWKLGRKDFLPFGVWWGWNEFPTARFRAGLSLMFVLLLFLPKGRIWGLAGLLLLVLVPKSMIGFTRYQPSLWSLGCLAAVLAAERAEEYLDVRLSKILSAVVILMLCSVSVPFVCRITPGIECKAKEASIVRERIRVPFWAGPIEYRKNCLPFVENFVPRYNYLTCNANRVKLLIKELGREERTKVDPSDRIARALGWNEDWDERDWIRDSASLEESSRNSRTSTSAVAGKPAEGADRPATSTEWIYVPFGYWAPVDGRENHIVLYHDLTGRETERGNRSQLDADLVLRAWLITYPRAVWKRTMPHDFQPR